MLRWRWSPAGHSTAGSNWSSTSRRCSAARRAQGSPSLLKRLKTLSDERYMRDSAGRGDGLGRVVLLDALQSTPEVRPSPEKDGHHHNVHVVDQPGCHEVADHGGAAADAYVLAVRSLAGLLERPGRRGIDEVERRASLHFDGRACVMGEDEDRRMERRVGAPPAFPLWVLVPPRVAELSRAHDLGANSSVVLPHECVVDAAGSARTAAHLVPPPGDKHPFVQPFAGVSHRCFKALTFPGPITVERDGEELDARE